MTITLDDQRRLPEAGALGTASSPASVGFGAALRWRARRNRAFFIVTPLYALAALVALKLGWVHSDVLVSSAIFFILVMGLDLLYGCAGMLSFAHVGFFAVGAYAVAILSVTFGIDPWLAGAAGLVVNLLLSFVLGRICLRLSGSYFMLGTLAFGIMVHAVLTVAYEITGGDAGLGGIPRPSIGGLRLGSDRSFGTLVWLLAALLFWCTLTLSRSRAGRALRAVRTEPVAAACLGIHVDRLKTNVFVLSAIYASLAGSLFAMYHGAVHPDSFSLGVLLNVLLMLFLGGEGSIWGGLIGATFISILPDLGGSLHAAKDLVNGVLFSLIIFLFPSGIAGGIARLLARRRPSLPADAAVAGVAALPPLAPANDAGPATLQLDAVSKRFGGVQAVAGVGFSAAPGTVKGLIGPNGAGKSTLMNLISGVARADEGSVRLGGRDLVGLRPDQVARAGVQRTFQHERLFAHLDVIENVMVGHERGVSGSLRGLVWSAFALRGAVADELESRRVAHAWLAVTGLAAHADGAVDQLPNGLRKLIEVARACAARPQVLLLDETAAGLNDTERQAFRAIVRRLRDAGLTVVLIEHDIELVMELSDEICVVNFGRRIADGTPDAVRRDEQVMAAYLGT
jgi:branched-chain amino acid transport system permease protein